MNEQIDNSTASTEDGLAYEESLGVLHANDPLAAIKTMRLQQLAVCRLKSEQEMQAMRDEIKGNAEGMDDDPVSK